MIRLLDLDRGQELERRIRTNDGASGDERARRAGRYVYCVALSRLQPRAERVERRRVEAEPVAGRVPSFSGSELRVTRNGLGDMTSNLVPADQRRCDERCDENGGCNDRQPNRRTLRRTRTALKPSLHVIFFPSA